MSGVIIGVDPHKLSVTIEVVDKYGHLLGSGRLTTDRAGYAALRSYVKPWPQRVWAVEGANGAGRPLAQRLLEAGEQVLDVPAKLAARVRLFDTGHNRKTDARDAHSIALVAVRTTGLRQLRPDGGLEALRNLAHPGRSSWLHSMVRACHWNCAKNLQISPLVQVVTPLSLEEPSTGPGKWPPSKAAHWTGYPARQPE